MLAGTPIGTMQEWRAERQDSTKLRYPQSLYAPCYAPSAKNSLWGSEAVRRDVKGWVRVVKGSQFYHPTYNINFLQIISTQADWNLPSLVQITLWNTCLTWEPRPLLCSKILRTALLFRISGSNLPSCYVRTHVNGVSSAAQDSTAAWPVSVSLMANKVSELRLVLIQIWGRCLWRFLWRPNVLNK